MEGFNTITYCWFAGFWSTFSVCLITLSLNDVIHSNFQLTGYWEILAIDLGHVMCFGSAVSMIGLTPFIDKKKIMYLGTLMGSLSLIFYIINLPATVIIAIICGGGMFGVGFSLVFGLSGDFSYKSLAFACSGSGVGDMMSSLLYNLLARYFKTQHIFWFFIWLPPILPILFKVLINSSEKPPETTIEDPNTLDDERTRSSTHSETVMRSFTGELADFEVIQPTLEEKVQLFKSKMVDYLIPIFAASIFKSLNEYSFLPMLPLMKGMTNMDSQFRYLYLMTNIGSCIGRSSGLLLVVPTTFLSKIPYAAALISILFIVELYMKSFMRYISVPLTLILVDSILSAVSYSQTLLLIRGSSTSHFNNLSIILVGFCFNLAYVLTSLVSCLTTVIYIFYDVPMEL